MDGGDNGRDVLEERHPQEGVRQHFEKLFERPGKMLERVVGCFAKPSGRQVSEIDPLDDPGVEIPGMIVVEPFDKVESDGDRKTGERR